MKAPSGFVVIGRPMLTHVAFRNEGEAMCFAWMIVRAAWQPVRVHYKGRPIYLKRGELALSLRDAARHLERSIGWIQRLLNRFRIESLIDTRTDSGVLVITICNYSKYQDRPSKTDSPTDSPTDSKLSQSRFTEQQREQESPPIVPPLEGGDGKRQFLPNDWKPPPVAELPPKARGCAAQWSSEAYEREAEAFACYWQSEHKMKTDWVKTWANRIIRDHWRVMQDARRQGFTGQGGGDKPLYQLVNEGRA